MCFELAYTTVVMIFEKRRTLLSLSLLLLLLLINRMVDKTMHETSVINEQFFNLRPSEHRREAGTCFPLTEIITHT